MTSVPCRLLTIISLALATGGCGGDPVSPPPDPTPRPELSITDRSRAFFFINRVVLESDGWPERYGAYGIFVCDPVLTAAHIAQIRGDFPGAVLLTYANAQSVRIHMHTQPYWQALTAAFDSSLCIRNLETDTVVRLDYDTPAFVLRPPSIEALVAFHHEVTMALGTDGIYVDQVTWTFPEWKRVLLLQLAPVFDVDDDGIADDLAKLDLVYGTWKPHFLQRLREEVGDQAILLANTNGPLGHPAVNGMCIENVHYRFTVAQARAWITEQVWLSRRPRYNVLWAFNGVSWWPSEALARELPSVHVGDLMPRDPDPDIEPREF